MGDGTAIKSVVGVVSGIIMLAVIAVLVKNGGGTAQAVGAATSGFAADIRAASAG